MLPKKHGLAPNSEPPTQTTSFVFVDWNHQPVKFLFFLTVAFPLVRAPERRELDHRTSVEKSIQRCLPGVYGASGPAVEALRLGCFRTVGGMVEMMMMMIMIMMMMMMDDDDDDDEALRIYDTFKMNGNACNVSGMNDVVHMKCTKDVKDISWVWMRICLSSKRRTLADDSDLH